MSSINLGADDPFEVLGVPRTKPIHEIRERTQQLVTKHDSDEAISAIGEAIDEIQNGSHVKETDGTRIEPLAVEVTDETVAVNESTTVTVTDIAGTSVEDAEVKVEGSREGFTDSDGEKTLSFSSAGSYEVAANNTHPDDDHEYRNGSATVEVEKLRQSLVFADCPDTATVGEDIQLRVTDSNQNGMGGIQLEGKKISAEDPTDGDGWVTAVPTDVGDDVELVATKDDTSNRVYAEAKTTIAVAEREVHLEFADPPAEVTYDEPIEFQVVDGDDSGVGEVTLSAADETATTDEQGYATLRFQNATLVTETIEATKDGGSGVRIAPATTDVTIVPKSVQLEIKLLSETVLVDEPSTFLVTNDDDIPVESAYVSGTDGTNGWTDATGTADLTFNDGGTQTVLASKADQRDVREFEGDNVSVEVELPKKNLQFDTLPSDATVGETVAVGVCTQNGEAKCGVDVDADDATHGRTDEQGIAYIRFASAGDKEIRASKTATATEEYTATKQSITVERDHRTLQFLACPDTAVAGETIQLRVADEHGPVEATVTSSENESVTTAADGTAEFVPPTSGTLTITATKEDTESATYGTAKTTVDVSERDIDLRFDQVPSTVEYSTTGLVRVVDGTGTGVRGTEVSIPGSTATTDEQGYAALSFDSVTLGSVTVEATDPFQNETSERVTDEITVRENHTDLSIEPLDDPVVGEPVSFEVTDRQTRPVAEVTVSSTDGSVEARTDEDGLATLVFDEAGEQTVRASKPGDSGLTYDDDTTQVTVQQQRVYLRIDSVPEHIVAGEPVAVVVTTSGGTAVEGAVVTAQDGTDARTDSQGHATVKFQSTGKKRLIISKPTEDGVEYRRAYERVEIE